MKDENLNLIYFYTESETCFSEALKGTVKIKNDTHSVFLKRKTSLKLRSENPYRSIKENL